MAVNLIGGDPAVPLKQLPDSLELGLVRWWISLVPLATVDNGEFGHCGEMIELLGVFYDK